MSDDHYWISDNRLWEYVPMDGPTHLDTNEACRRLNDQREVIAGLKAQLEEARDWL